MKVITQLGLLDINPESVIAIKQAPVMPESVEFNDLTHCVEFDNRFYSMGDKVVCISEADAERLSEMAEIEIEGKDVGDKPEVETPYIPNPSGGKRIFVPFQKQLVLNEWEKVFDESIAWKNGITETPSADAAKEPESAPSSFSSNREISHHENSRPISIIEQTFRAMENRPA